MSATAAEDLRPKPREPSARAATSTGRVGMAVFLVSDAFSFGALLAAYVLFRRAAPVWRDPALGEPALHIPFAAALTLVLAASSVSMALARAAALRGDRARLIRWLRLTVLGGALFLVGEAHEYFGSGGLLPAGALGGLSGAGLVADGLRFGGSHYASTFFVVTGFHGVHVLAGVIYLLGVLARAELDEDPALDYVATAALYWQFVDAVWILVFALVYLW